MKFFIVLMLVIFNNGAPQIWYNVNTNIPFETKFACKAQIKDQAFQKRLLTTLDTGMARLACLPEDQVENYIAWANEQNKLNKG
jgi:hypothetical protein